MDLGTYFFTSESVTEGHPDKMCDKISDALLDAYLAEDAETRFACDTEVKGQWRPNGDMDYVVFLGGEITSKADVDIEKVVRRTIKEIGYDDDAKGFNFNTCRIIPYLTTQSPDIAQGVDEGEKKEQGAGDQGIMFGYACDETPELMPLSLMLAQRLSNRLAYVRKDPKSELPFLWPDGKSQVTVEYASGGKPRRLADIVIAAQHADVDMGMIREKIMKHVIVPVCGKCMDSGTVIHINATGKFNIGGPLGDSGVTGRKIIVDTYGGHAAHGGGAFSGKDPSKVDRSGAYAARYIAKNIVAAGIAHECEVQLSYCIGLAEPRSIRIVLDGKKRNSNAKLVKAVRGIFPVKPADIISHFDLKRPIYEELAAYGHFGRPNMPWEKNDKVKRLQRMMGI